ncbi:hypothetical protein RA27_10110 [Ruegeria sp. ANG-R]|uniref:hypothetical protein n=1 Tax=Ruegeria sp. ANG-R TaxID=1577903 RepID=UPI00057D6295|nr:hypothetical protein [Ruegeria sp. ANG-R]KIC41581.1 hypothetical protein RA27_10110 [Ruegeria sp. ANG-R]
MKKIETKVLNNNAPKRGRTENKPLFRPIGQAVKAILMRPRLIVLSGMAGFLLFVGTRHVGWEYQCRHQMRGFGTCNAVSWCAYYGVQGRREVRPEYGTRCKLVTFLPLNLNKLIEGMLS